MSYRTERRAGSALTAPGRTLEPPARMTIRRVRLRSLARVGFGLGWLVSLLPALLVSAVGVWLLHGLWGIIDGWSPWRPWSADLRIAGLTIPSPELRPRELLHVERLYQLLGPIGHHPYLATAGGAVALTIVGGIVFACALLLAGIGYNTFSRVTGGIEFELAPRQERPLVGQRGRRDSRPADEWRDNTDLDW